MPKAPLPERSSMVGKSAYCNEWIAEKLDRINLTVPKGRKESVNGFINRAINETMEREQ